MFSLYLIFKNLLRLLFSFFKKPINIFKVLLLGLLVQCYGEKKSTSILGRNLTFLHIFLVPQNIYFAWGRKWRQLQVILAIPFYNLVTFKLNLCTQWLSNYSNLIFCILLVCTNIQKSQILNRFLLSDGELGWIIKQYPK